MCRPEAVSARAAASRGGMQECCCDEEHMASWGLCPEWADWMI